MLLVIEPQTDQQFEALFLLRWQVLRKPWDKPRGSEVDEHESTSTHAAIFNNENCIACARLQFNTDHQAQIRYMAVDPAWQKKGLGEKVLAYLENVAKVKKAKKIILQAREGALGFYLKNGYVVKEKSYVLFESIQHFLMEKNIG